MNWSAELLLIFGAITFLLAIGLWIPFAIGITAILLMLWSGGLPELDALGLVFWGGANSFVLTAIPLFILMAEVLIASDISARLYRGLARLTQRWPGGLLHTNVAGCAVFSAVCGSSIATAAAISRVALPEIRSLGYDIRATCGSLAAGGTLGILIPPSGAMIIYGVLTDTSIARLFTAGIVPGLVLTALFMAYIVATARLRPRIPPAAGAIGGAVGGPVGGFMAELLLLMPFALLIAAVIGSIYLGWATPTEAAAVGVFAAILIGMTIGKLNLARLLAALRATVRVSGALLVIIAMAQTLSYALSVSGIPGKLASYVIGLGLGRTMFLIVLVLLYTALGCIMDGVAMTMITVPILFPVVQALGIDPVFFGILLVVMMELGLITPPFGLNLFVIQQISGESIETVLLGSIPYCVIILGLVGLLLAFPDLAMALG